MKKYYITYSWQNHYGASGLGSSICILKKLNEESIDFIVNKIKKNNCYTSIIITNMIKLKK